jgi:hypothetical protein
MPALLDVDFVSQKLVAVLDQIEHLRTSDFPYVEPKSALGLLSELYKQDLERLSSIDETVDVRVRQQACAHANARISQYYPVLGFILRSTNVRNAFEIYNPLLQMCQTIYGSEAKLIMSSEWVFSPFTYPAVTDELPHLMFIGLPSTEAGNSLIVPLAGHELGHSVWRRRTNPSPHISDLDKRLQAALTDAYTTHWAEFQKVFGVSVPATEILSDLFLRGIWTQSYKLAARQTEELFCDAIGLRLFGESFLYSFVYLISPYLGDRAPHYPTLAARVRVSLEAAKRFSIDVPDGFASYFAEPNKRLNTADKFILDMADEATDALASVLISAVETHVASTKMVLPSSAERDRIVQHFCALSPASGAKSLGDIVNAGWKIRLNWDLWSDFEFDEKTRIEILNDLVFKTMEVSEFERLTTDA